MAQCSWVEWHDLDRVEGDLGLTLGPVCMPVASSSVVDAVVQAFRHSGFF